MRPSAPAFAEKLRLEQLSAVVRFIDATKHYIDCLVKMNENVKALQAVGQASGEHEAAKWTLTRWAWALREAAR